MPAIGDELSVRLNGELLVTHRDATLSKGIFSFTGQTGATMRSFEYAVLD